MVDVRHCVNGTIIVMRDGGFMECVQFLNDDQIILAQGIAAESFLEDTRTRAALPEALGEQGPTTPKGYEVPESLLSRSDTVKSPRRASQAGWRTTHRPTPRRLAWARRGLTRQRSATKPPSTRAVPESDEMTPSTMPPACWWPLPKKSPAPSASTSKSVPSSVVSVPFRSKP